jgi:threonine-phosphate decarboxylase
MRWLDRTPADHSAAMVLRDEEHRMKTLANTLWETVSTGSLHGGRVYEAARKWNVVPENVIDFSSNINPLGPPPRVLAEIKRSSAASSLRSYPDTLSFLMALAEKHRLMPDEIVVGSGIASLLFTVIRALLPKRVLMLEPAFAEYARACAAVKATITTSPLSEDNCFAPDFDQLMQALNEQQFDLVILNSPHNPSGRLYARKDLLMLIDAAERNDTTVVLDEAFIDYAPESSLLALAATKANLIVLRSLTKFYAMPGLRVGYAVCHSELAKKISMQIDPWSVSTIALEAARATLAEDDFEVQTRQVNSAARAEFVTALQEAGLQVFPSAANFLLARLPHGSAANLSHWLEAERILIRQCDSFAGLTGNHIRLAIRSSADNRKLAALIGSWLGDEQMNREEQ